MKKELFVFYSFFIALITLGTQIWGTQKWYTIVNYGLNQPLPFFGSFKNSTPPAPTPCPLPLDKEEGGPNLLVFLAGRTLELTLYDFSSNSLFNIEHVTRKIFLISQMICPHRLVFSDC